MGERERVAAEGAEQDGRCPVCRSPERDANCRLSVGSDVMVCATCERGLRVNDRASRALFLKRGVIRKRERGDVPAHYVTTRPHDEACAAQRATARVARARPPPCLPGCSVGEPWPTLRLLPKQLREMAQ